MQAKTTLKIKVLRSSQSQARPIIELDMKTFVIVNALYCDSESFSPLVNAYSAFDLALARSRAFPGFASGAIVASSTGKVPGIARGSAYPDVVGAEGFALEIRPEWTPEGMLAFAEKAAREASCDTVAFVFGDAAFMGEGLCNEVFGVFDRYRVDYANADSYPMGGAPELFSIDALQAMIALAAKLPAEFERDSLFRILSKDINFFDIETALAPSDVREFRLAFFCSGKRGRLTCERALAAGIFGPEAGEGRFDWNVACERIPGALGMLRTVPAFYSIQIAQRCPQTCRACPYPKLADAKGGLAMPRDRFAAVLDQIVGLSGDAVIDLSAWGEASSHPEVEALIADALGHPTLSVIVETSGIGWKEGALERLAAVADERLYWVLSLDASSEAAYVAARGAGFAEAKAFALEALGRFPRTAYVQAVRTLDDEDDLELFYKEWKRSTQNVIIQKYDDFLGFLPPKKVVDLSPPVRRPCWHLARDMFVSIDGSVAACRELSLGDGKAIAKANAFEPGGLEAAWEEFAPRFDAQVGLDFGGACGRCDEYYTFNF